MNDRGFASQVNEQPVAVGVPHRAFGESEAGGQQLRLLAGFNDAVKIIRHNSLLRRVGWGAKLVIGSQMSEVLLGEIHANQVAERGH